jgi:hypothetical protein
MRITKYFKRKLKYFSAKTYLRVTSFSKLIDTVDLTVEQRTGLKIIKMLASQADSEILIAPISEKYYVKNRDIFIVIDREQVSILNSVYHYDLRFSDKVHSHLTSFLKRVIENRRSKMETMMRAKVQRSLTHIYTELLADPLESVN